MNLRTTWTLSAAMLAAFIFSGCNGEPSPVGATGKVTLDGQPISEGTIFFEPLSATAGQQRDAAIKQGEFHLPTAEGILPGVAFRVSIKAFRKTGRKYPNADMAASYDETEQYIPAEYNSASKLEAVLSDNERENHLIFDLVSPK